MKNIRLGFKKRRGKLKMSPELTVQANREMKMFEPWNFNFGPGDLGEMKDKDMILAVARRAEELRSRGYPQWLIEKDLEKLTRGMV